MANEVGYSKELILYGGTIGMLLLSSGIILFIYLYQRKLLKRKVMLEAVKDDLRKTEINSAYEMLQIQEVERRKIASEIHDNLGSIMVTLSMYADILHKGEGDKDMIGLKISEIAKMASQQVRSISHKLDSGVLQYFGLEKALEDISETIKGTGQIDFELVAPKVSHLINQTNSIQIYRIVQELTSNSLKHSRANRIMLKLIPNSEEIYLEYTDNGVGFEVEDSSKGLGLKSIENRVNGLNGNFKIKSSKEGTTFLIKFPHDSANKDFNSR